MAEKLTKETKQIMDERFGCDSLLALATVEDGKPYVRTVNAYYEDGAFYIVTYALSNKMRKSWQKSEQSSPNGMTMGTPMRRIPIPAFCACA